MVNNFRHGTVGIEEKQGKYRIRLPRAIAKDSARYISTRLDATPANYRKVQRCVFEIEEDIANETFDITLEKYQFNRAQLAVVRSKPAVPIALKEQCSLRSLWSRYCEFIELVSQVDFDGTQVEYSLGASPPGLLGGTAIFANNIGTKPDLVAILQGVNLGDLSLSEPCFNFVKPQF